MIALVITYFILLGLAVATAKGFRTNSVVAARSSTRAARSPVTMTERGSAVLVWLEKNPRPGTPRSRSRVARGARQKIWGGLSRAGVLPGFRCLHSHEGAWNSNTGNGYWGGLQMDRGFMGTYGSEYIRLWGYAHAWPVWAQLVAGYRAYHGYHGYGARGWSPWGTRGLCGL